MCCAGGYFGQGEGERGGGGGGGCIEEEEEEGGGGQEEGLLRWRRGGRGERTNV